MLLPQGTLTDGEEDLRPSTTPPSPLRHAQAPGLPASGARGPGRGGHLRRATPTRGGAEESQEEPPIGGLTQGEARLEKEMRGKEERSQRIEKEARKSLGRESSLP